MAVASPAGRQSIDTAVTGSGPQGFSETFYAYLSQANNNGSAFAGYGGFVQPNAGNLGSHGITFADLLGGFTMLFARYATILFALAVAGVARGQASPLSDPEADGALPGNEDPSLGATAAGNLAHRRMQAVEGKLAMLLNQALDAVALGPRNECILQLLRIDPRCVLAEQRHGVV